MAEELENKQEPVYGQDERGREANSSESQGNSEQKDYRSSRPQRPRIHSQRAYSSDRSNQGGEGGFRPEGFGAGLQGAQGGQYQGGYRPRNNYQGGYQQRQQGGYQPRQRQQGGYQQRQQGGYQQRQQGGYQQRQQGGYQQGGYQQRQQGGYQQRQQGGYQQRQQGGYQQCQQQGGYQPRQQQDGYQPRQQQEGYQQRQQGGYQQRQQGGYQQRGYQQRGYQQGGYQQEGFQQGGYQQRGGYGQPRRQHTPGYNPNAKYSLKKRIEYKEENIDPNEPIRLNKYLANAGVCSRREADEYIQAGAVLVNGTVVTELGTKVLRSDEVKFRDQPVTMEKKVYVLLNKPKDYVTTSDDPQQRKTVMDLVKNACEERIYPVGRLDRNTTGVLLLTNDGDLASKLTHPKFLKKKVYHVYLDKPVTATDLQKIAEGIELEDGEVHADAIEYASPTDEKQVGIEIHSGKNRIVRRIFESLGYRVVKLDRVQFAGLTKKNLRRGDWRFLTQKEVEMLRMGAFE